MPDSTAVLTALRNDLEGAGLIRRPGTPGPLPPAHVEPRDGAPAPGEREAPETNATLVVTMRLAGEVSESRFNAYRRRTIVDLIYRSSGTAGLKAGRALDAAIRRRIVDDNAANGLGFTLDAGGANLGVLEAGVWAGLGPVADVDGIRTERSALMLEVLSA